MHCDIVSYLSPDCNLVKQKLASLICLSFSPEQLYREQNLQQSDRPQSWLHPDHTGPARHCPPLTLLDNSLLTSGQSRLFNDVDRPCEAGSLLTSHPVMSPPVPATWPSFLPQDICTCHPLLGCPFLPLSPATFIHPLAGSSDRPG